MQGSSVTFSSDANGVPEPTFSWTKDGSAVTADNRIRLSADNKELSLSNVNGTDSGEYRCVATNSVEVVSSDAATLTVHCKKTFTRFLLINPTEKSFSTKLTSFQIPSTAPILDYPSHSIYEHCLSTKGLVRCSSNLITFQYSCIHNQKSGTMLENTIILY